MPNLAILSAPYLPYKVQYHNAFEKGVKKIDKQFLDTFYNRCDDIQNDPSIGETMHGSFKKLDIKKATVKQTNPEYRILYKTYSCSDKNTSKLKCSAGIVHSSIKELQDCDGYVDYIICGPREMFNNFYKLPLDKLKQYL